MGEIFKKAFCLLLCLTIIGGCFADIIPSNKNSSEQFRSYNINNTLNFSSENSQSSHIFQKPTQSYRTTINAPLSNNPSTNQSVPVNNSLINNRSYIPDRVIVQYKSDAISAMGGVSQVSATLNSNIQAKVLADESTLGLSGIQLVEIPNGTPIEVTIQYYTNSSNVAYAQPDYIYQACDEEETKAVMSVADNFSNFRTRNSQSGSVSPNFSSPSIPSYVTTDTQENNTTSTESWPNDYYYSYQWDMVKMAAPSAWAVSTGSSSVTVAVVDTGVDYTHPDLAANCVSGYDFYNGDSNPMDDNGHGTHCAGSIAAIGNNGIGIAGVTWSSKIMPLKFLGSGGTGSTSGAISAFAWGYAKGVRIFSNSWGGYGTDTALQSAINTYSDAIFICAAGNGDNYGNPINIDSYPFSPAGLSCSNIVSVAATGSSDTLASWSNYGAISVDVAAPGVNIWSCQPGNSYQYMSGTSMAAPHVAGLAALVKALNSGYTIAQIKSAILSGVDTVSGLSGKCVTGGRVNAYNSLPYYDASVVSTSIPTTMVAGNSYPVTITMKNTGTITWSEANYIRLGAVGDWNGDAAKFSTPRIYLPTGKSVAPRESYTFTFTMTAPSTVGTYTPKYQMVWDGHQWFGDQATTTITVNNGVAATVQSISIPSPIGAGYSDYASIIMKNTGEKTWNETSFIRLGTVGDWNGDAAKFSAPRISIPTGTNVITGNSYNFTFPIKAPSASGTYTLKYQMVWDGHTWFGDQASTNVTVNTGVAATVQSTSIPTTMVAGYSYPVSITMKNTGTIAWSETNYIRLGTVGDWKGDAAKFSTPRIYLPTGTSVAPRESYTFTFSMTAPSTVGTYTPKYQMVWDGHQWFGDQAATTITVNNGVAATVQSISIPSSIGAGYSDYASIIMKNTGEKTWNETSFIRLGTVGDWNGDAAKFSAPRITIPTGINVITGNSYNFTFPIKAPSVSGTYTPKYQMVWDGHQWFGDQAATTITVNNGVAATVQSTSIPTTMRSSNTYSASITTKNTGTITWNEISAIRLGAVGDWNGDAAKFSTPRISIPTGTTVVPGDSYTFTFTMTAPLTKGIYIPKYQMVWDGHKWFGDQTSVSITVT